MKRLTLFFILLCLKLTTSAQGNYFEMDSTKFNKPLMRTLDTICKDDQIDRLKLAKLSGASRDSLWKIIREKDAKNQVKVNDIIAKYGWLGPQRLG
jgi:hypothetical protein